MDIIYIREPIFIAMVTLMMIALFLSISEAIYSRKMIKKIREQILQKERKNKMVKKGDRVGAIQKTDGNTIYLFGYGVYQGQEIPPSGFCHDMGVVNPKILLDNGNVVWGHECWWGNEEEIKKQEHLFGNTAIVEGGNNE